MDIHGYSQRYVNQQKRDAYTGVALPRLVLRKYSPSIRRSVTLIVAQ